MSADRTPQHLSVLERLDLLLASRMAETVGRSILVEDLTSGAGADAGLASAAVDRTEWVASVLGLRGLLVRPEDVAAVAEDREDEGRYQDRHQECQLIRGGLRIFAQLQSWAAMGRAPEGWLLVELFKELTLDVPRFRNNQLRRDMPWDAILYVNYPEPGRLHELLDSFTEANCYMDHRMRFSGLHPVRQSFRVMWHFARISPFPDFNLSMAWVAMNMYLMQLGYPMLSAERADREQMHKMMTGPVPLRMARLEQRLLSAVQSLGPPAND